MNIHMQCKTAVRWYFRVPGMVYAGNVYGANEREAREAARKSLGVNRLPRGAEFWQG
jgi:hypothetical protein